MVTQRSYPREAADPYCLRAGEAEHLLAGHPWRRFAVVGDGIAEGAGERPPGTPTSPGATGSPPRSGWASPTWRT